MNRKALVDAMQEVEPAVAQGTKVPLAWTHLWFTGGEVIGYNGTMAISAKCSTDWAAAVPRKLVSLLKTSKAEEVDLELDGDTLKIKLGASRIKLPVLPADQFGFTFPKPHSKQPLGVDPGRFMQAMQTCLHSCSNITHTIDLLGVTVQIDRGDLLMFATDYETISHGFAPLARDDDPALYLKRARTILPTAFCKQLVKIADGAPELFLEITDDYAMIDHGAVSLYSRTIEPDKASHNFIAMVDEVVTKRVREHLVEIPEKLITMLENAAIISTKDDDATCVLDIYKDELKLITTSKAGVVDEVTLMEKGHPDIKLNVNAKRMLTGITKFNKFAVTTEAVVMMRDKCLYLVAKVN